LLIISKWINEQAARRWLESDQRKAMESDARTLGTSQDGDVVVADFVHQQFGALGGVVIGAAVDQMPAQIGGKQ
jgi:heme-degrading monooxygenase HmoA